MAIRIRTLPSLLAAGLFLAACGEGRVDPFGGGSGGGGGGGGAPSNSQRLELTYATEDEVEASIAALTLAAPGAPPGFVAGGCPTLAGTLDSDHDSIPNDQIRSYSNPPCMLPGFRGDSMSITGTVEVQDSTSSDTSSYLLGYSDLIWNATDSAGGSRSYSARRDGDRSRTLSDSSVLLSSTITSIRTRPGRANATVDVVTTAEFVPDFSGDLELLLAPPSGTLTLSGSLHWKRSTEDWNLALATVTPLRYEPTCVSTPQRITSGVLTLSGTINGAAGVLTLTFSQCGSDPARSWAGTP